MAPKKPRRNGEVLAAGWLAHIGFLLSPVTVAAIAVLIWWYVPRHLGIMVAKRDEDVITNYHLPGLIVFHAIIAGFLLAKVLVGYSRMWISIRRDDEFAFREALEERIPKVAHLLLATLSVMVLENTMIIGYEATWVGVKTVGEMAYVLALYWQVATVLDDPTRAPGLSKKIPPDWLARIKRGLRPGEHLWHQQPREPDPFTLAGWPPASCQQDLSS